jgi:hypothetical protein
MRGMDESYGMGAGASVRKGKTAKQVRRARKAIDAKKSASPKPKMSSSKMDASSRAGYRAPGTKAKAMPRRSADAYGSPAKKRKGALGGLSPVLKSVTRGLGNIQNKAGDKNKNKK